MSEHAAKRLDEIDQAITDAISSFETQIGELRQHAAALLEEIERERTRVQTRIEELLIDQPEGGEDELQRLRVTEDRLTENLTRASTVSRQLSDFLQLLSITRQQWGEAGSLPGLEAAQRLTVRQAMIRAQEDERRRLAREIHDGPAQVLANAILSVQFAARVLARTPQGIPDSLREELERIEQVLRDGLSETRRFIVDLQPTMLKEHGLLVTLRSYIESYRRLFPGQIELDLPDSLPPLTSEQELAIFRIIQEALHNVQRHARARRIGLRISVGPAEMVIMVEDDGQGFRPSAVASTSAGGFGLHGMRERAEVIGAQLTIRSEPGQGTTITLVVPLGSAREKSQAAARELPHAEHAEKERVG